MHLPPKIDSGNIEYKLKMTTSNKLYLIKQSTHLKIRCNNGRGMAIYLIGINDSGEILGINSKEFKLTLDNLQKIVDINQGMILQKTVNQLEGGKFWATIFILDHDINKDLVTTTTYTFNNNLMTE